MKENREQVQGMKWKEKAVWIGEKKLKVPIIQGGMGVGISLGRLAGSVAKEGAAGIISAAQIGYREPDFDADAKGANLRAIGKEMKKAREISPKGIVGFNIMVAMRHYEEYVREAVRAGADLIISGAGLPIDLPKYVEGSKVQIAPIVSTEKSAKVILKYWDKKYHRTADLIVIEGPSAGGHLGFTKEQLALYDGETYAAEIRKIREVVREYEERYDCKIPIFLAGGIENYSDVTRALELGMDGVQVATRFVTTEECDADIRYKEAYVNAKEEEIVLVKSPVGMPGRAILNPFMRRVMDGEQIPHSPCHGCIKNCRPKEIPYCITEALIAAAKGDTEHALLFCGKYAYRAQKIETVKEVIASLLDPCV